MLAKCNTRYGAQQKRRLNSEYNTGTLTGLGTSIHEVSSITGHHWKNYHRPSSFMGFFRAAYQAIAKKHL
jgi:hypothetical protein